MTQLPYETETPPSWAKAVNSWPWVPVPDGDGEPISWSKHGDCPRCHHGMSMDLGLVFGITALPPTTKASCNCNVVHQEGATGCGQSAQIERPHA
jgi:hypothetical protein